MLTTVAGELVPVELLGENHRSPAEVGPILVGRLTKSKLREAK